MSRNNHARPRRAWGSTAPLRTDRAPRHQPRPAPRRAATRAATILRHLKEYR